MFLVTVTVVTYVEVIELFPMNTLDARPRAWLEVSPEMVRVKSDEQIGV